MRYFLKQIKKIPSFFIKKIDPIGYVRKEGLKIGKNCVIESFNFGTEPYLIAIGNHVEIATNVTFITHDGATWVLRENPKYRDVIRYGKITIHDNVFIGHGSVILPGVEIGENVVVGAGSVVTKNIPSNSIVAGSPAKVLSTFEEYAEKCLRETPAWDRENYRKDKRAEVMRVVMKREKE